MARRTPPRRIANSEDHDLFLAKEPISVVAGTYGHPIHPILVTLPIGMWVASLVFDIISRNADDGPAFANGAYWLVGLGIIGAAAAAIFGLLDLLRVRRGTRAWTTGLLHLTLNSVVLVLFIIAWFVRRGRDGFPPTSTGLIILSVVALILLSASGVLGGRLAYRYGVRVADEGTQRSGFEPARRPR